VPELARRTAFLPLALRSLWCPTHSMRRAVAGWVFVPVACLAAFVCLLYLQSYDGSVDRTSLLPASAHNTHVDPDALVKKFSNDMKQVALADQALHAIAAASLPASEVHGIVAQRSSAAVTARISVEARPAALRRNRPGVAQHFVQLARQWVARVEPLQNRLVPLQRELAVYDESVGRVKQHLAKAESERDSLLAVIKSSRDSVASAQRLLDNAQANKLELQRKMVHVANQISAASGTPPSPPPAPFPLAAAARHHPPHATPPPLLHFSRV